MFKHTDIFVRLMKSNVCWTILFATLACVFVQPIYGQGEEQIIFCRCVLVITTKCVPGAANNSCEALRKRCGNTTWNLENLGITRIQPSVPCKTLTKLNLNRNRLQNIPYLLNAPVLTELRVVSNNISTLIALKVDRNRPNIAISMSVFKSTPKLKIIDVSYNRITQVHSHTFADLADLAGLSMAGNQITSLPHDVFLNNHNLQALDISNNRLSSLPDTIFSKKSMLSVLQLQNNQLAEVSSALLSSLSDVRLLNVRNNRLSSLNVSILGNTPGLPSSRQIELSYNPFRCTFSLCPLAAALQNTSIFPKTLQFDADKPITCDYPSYVRGFPVQEVFENRSCGTGECQAYRCDFERYQRATCHGNTCSCNAPEWSGDGLECVCSEGYEQVPSRTCSPSLSCKNVSSCRDINECELQLHNCSTKHVCVNTPGSFQCNCSSADNCQTTTDPTRSPDAKESEISTAVVALAVAGGAAGLLALFCVIFHLLTRCRKRSNVRQESQCPLSGVTRHNPDYNDHSYPDLVNPHRRVGFNPSYEKADNKNTPRSAMSPAYQVSTLSVPQSGDSASVGMVRSDFIQVVVDGASELENSYSSSNMVSNGRSRYVGTPGMSLTDTMKSTFTSSTSSQDGNKTNDSSYTAMRTQQPHPFGVMYDSLAVSPSKAEMSAVSPGLIQRESTIYDDILVTSKPPCKPVATVSPYQHASIHIVSDELTEASKEPTELPAEHTAEEMAA